MHTFRSSLNVALRALTVVLLASGIAFGDSWVSVTPEGGVAVKEGAPASSPHLTVRGFDEGGIDVVVDTAGFTVAPRQTKGGEFVEVGWFDAPIAGEIGTPALPVIRRLFIAPPDTTVSVTVREGDSTVIDTSAIGAPLLVIPVQPPIPTDPLSFIQRKCNI